MDSESGEVLEQPAQRGYECSVPRGVQDQVGWSSRKPDQLSDLEPGGPVCEEGLEFNDPWDLFQPKPFYDCVGMWKNNPKQCSDNEEDKVEFLREQNPSDSVF